MVELQEELAKQCSVPLSSDATNRYSTNQDQERRRKEEEELARTGQNGMEWKQRHRASTYREMHARMRHPVGCLDASIAAVLTKRLVGGFLRLKEEIHAAMAATSLSSVGGQR